MKKKIIQIVSTLLRSYREACRRLYMRKKIEALKNKNMSIISSNCNGGVILHDLKMPFQSPFVNLWIKPKDFLKICHSLEHYMSLELVPSTEEEGVACPVGLLGDVKLYFEHYKTFEEAKETWERRKQRIDYNNLFFMFTDRDGCAEEDLVDFDNLPFKYKVVFVNKPRPNIKCAYYLKGFENQNSVGICSEWLGKLSWKKHYDKFDFVKFLNKEWNL